MRSTFFLFQHHSEVQKRDSVVGGTQVPLLYTYWVGVDETIFLIGISAETTYKLFSVSIM